MHGRKRLPLGETTDKVKDESRTKKLEILLSEFTQNHKTRCYTKEGLKHNAQLLELNPEVYTAWNYRKLAVRHLMDSEPDEAARKLLLDEELQLVERALRTNVKSYGAWYHRKWIIAFGLSSLDHEFLLLKKLLKDDCRNFHGWHHRRFAVKIKGMLPEKELDYATEKINENFSNYSAWHYRSTLLSRLIRDKRSEEEILADEYKLVNQAYFTEPDDQSAWFYNTWLLGETKVDSCSNVVGSWPEDGSTVSVEVYEGASTVAVNYRTPLDSQHSFRSPGLPLILSFDGTISGTEVTIASKPELEHLSDVHWKSLSSVQEPSKTWVAELPIRDYVEAEYTFSLGIASSTGVHKFSFQVQVTNMGTLLEEKDVSQRNEIDLRSFAWPGKVSSPQQLEEETRLELQRVTVDQSLAKSRVAKPLPVDSVSLSEDDGKQDSTVVGPKKWQERILEEQIEILQELLELEQNSKWALLTLARVCVAHGACRFTDEVLKLYKRLSEIDPDHAEFYKAQHSSLYVEKVSRCREDLRKFWWDIGGRVISAGWLRWNGLSLSNFTPVGRLLWVQRLDLSHNQLRTVDGLEAMQLLVALDISYNKVPHITSLAPLRLIPRLQYLNISYNEIGSHSVDTSRYSFPSVLTNQVHNGGSTVVSNWEVQSVFGGMKLRVLEIAGNTAASSNDFREAIVETLPHLELLLVELTLSFLSVSVVLVLLRYHLLRRSFSIRSPHFRCTALYIARS